MHKQSLSNNIILTGFMGTGKTTVGQRLAKKLNYRFIDTDVFIAELAGQSIKEIFAAHGEARFRQLEREAAQALAQQPNYVIATGGGMLLDEYNVQQLRQTGKIFCLTAPPEEILRRVKADQKGIERPLLNVANPAERIGQLLAKRREQYASFDQIDTQDLDPDEIAEQILNKIYQKPKTITVNGKTQVVGLLGWPVSHTKSPLMHNAAAAVHGQNIAYLPFPVHPEDIEDAVSGLAALGARGVNVTVPHKQAVMPFLDHIDPAAAAIGAVNTIIIDRPEDGATAHLSGYNTDWIGLRDDLITHNVEFAQRDCLLLGAGGSARAVVYMLLAAKAHITICARRLEQADQLIGDMRLHFPAAQLNAINFNQLGEAVAGLTTPLIINSTPVGMHPKVEASPWPADVPFPNGSFVYDLIYTPRETKLMAQARAAGCGAQHGLGMLVGQGAEAFRLWTDITPDFGVMERAIIS